MFELCRILTSLDLSTFKTNSLKETQNMFYSWYSLTSINLSIFNTEKLENVNSMLSGCKSITSFDFSKFNTKNLKIMDIFNLYSI